MGLFTYSKQQADKIIARSFIDFLGGTKEINKVAKSNYATLKFLTEKQFFTERGLGSLEALDETSKIELSALFRTGVKYNDFNDFFTFVSRFNPMFSVGKDFEKTYLDRYNEVFDKALIKEFERKNKPTPEFSDDDRVKIINRNEILESFKTPLFSMGVMGEVLKGNYGTTTKEGVALFASASKVLEFYHENDAAVEHYRNIIQSCLFEDNYEIIEKVVGTDLFREPSSRNSKRSNSGEFVTPIFDNVTSETEEDTLLSGEEDALIEDSTPETEEELSSDQQAPFSKKLKEAKIVEIKEKRDGKIIKDSVLEDLKELGVNVAALQNALTQDKLIKFYLANKNKATIDDIKDIIAAEESVKTLVLEPIFKSFLGARFVKKFDPEQLSESQIELICNLVGMEEKDFSVLVKRVQNQSQIVKNLFKRTLTSSKEDKNIRKEIIKNIISTRVLANDNYRDFVSGLTSIFFEPEMKELIGKDINLEDHIIKENNKKYVSGYVKASGEVLFVEKIPVSSSKNENANAPIHKVSFTKLELEKFKNELWSTYGCDAQSLDLDKDFFLGNNEYLLEIAKISRENSSEMMAKINNSERTKEFIRTHRVFSDDELEKICGQVNVKDLDYSIFRSETFYKNAKQKALDKALKSYSKQNLKESDVIHDLDYFKNDINKLIQKSRKFKAPEKAEMLGKLSLVSNSEELEVFMSAVATQLAFDNNFLEEFNAFMSQNRFSEETQKEQEETFEQ